MLPLDRQVLVRPRNFDRSRHQIGSIVTNEGHTDLETAPMFLADGKANGNLSPIGIRPVGFHDLAPMFDFHVGLTGFVSGAPEPDEIRTRFDGPRFCRNDVGNRSREFLCFQIENLKRNLGRNRLASGIGRFEYRFVSSSGQLKRWFRFAFLVRFDFLLLDGFAQRPRFNVR